MSVITEVCLSWTRHNLIRQRWKDQWLPGGSGRWDSSGTRDLSGGIDGMF